MHHVDPCSATYSKAAWNSSPLRKSLFQMSLARYVRTYTHTHGHTTSTRHHLAQLPRHKLLERQKQTQQAGTLIPMPKTWHIVTILKAKKWFTRVSCNCANLKMISKGNRVRKSLLHIYRHISNLSICDWWRFLRWSCHFSEATV